LRNRVPGHEIAGHIDAVGDNVTAWRPGQRVGVMAGMVDIVSSASSAGAGLCHVRASTGHGLRLRRRYAEYMIARAETLAAIPDALPTEEAGPLCAGVTVYNARCHAGARAERSSPCTASVD
jgi:D-arabinose 1-dehydrogenase-like Zn-dependent alcohol dehydrogenase